MPTAARLFAAFGFALMAFIATEIYKPLLPEGTQMDMFSPINMAVAALVGWMVMGKVAGRGYVVAVSHGLRTAIYTLFYVLFIWSGLEMFERSTSLHYEGPFEALQAMVGLSIEYVQLGMTDPQVPIALLLGGILAAFFAEWASRQWT